MKSSLFEKEKRTDLRHLKNTRQHTDLQVLMIGWKITIARYTKCFLKILRCSSTRKTNIIALSAFWEQSDYLINIIIKSNYLQYHWHHNLHKPCWWYLTLSFNLESFIVKLCLFLQIIKIILLKNTIIFKSYLQNKGICIAKYCTHLLPSLCSYTLWHIIFVEFTNV